MASRPLFIVFEGGDGAGKTTQLERLAARIEGLGRRVVRLVEPTHGPVGSEIRRRAREGPPLEPREELDLFVVDRRANVEENVLPALGRGDVVLQDRYFYSTAAYQGSRDVPGLGPGDVLGLHAWAPRPDLVVLLDLPVERGLARVRERVRGDGFEQEELQRRVREAFGGMARDAPGLFAVIDAARPPDAVAADVWERVAPLLDEEDA